MAFESNFNESSPPLQKGQFQPASPTDLRSACPVVNALANHGYIPRDGRNVSYDEIKTAMSQLGIASTVRTTLAYGANLEHVDKLQMGFWAFLANPFAYYLRPLGLRNHGQLDSRGEKCLNLDQLNRHGAVEHDVSLSRRDFAQGDNHSKQEDLIAKMINAASDGKVLTTEDFAKLRAQRLEQQKRDNPELVFGSLQQTMAYGEAAFIQMTFGLGYPKYDVPVDRLKALFDEERLPREEGWKPRSWWTVGFLELTLQATKLRWLVDKMS